MNKIITTTLLLFVTLVTFAKQQFPTISTQKNTVYYYLQMQNGKGVITAQADNQKVVTAMPTAKQKSKQRWKVLKTNNKYTFVNADGQTLFYNNSTQRFCASKNANGIKELTIVESANSTYHGFEISTTGNGRSFLNQWGGAGIGKDLGLWDKNDPNNPLLFVLPSGIVINDVKPDAVSEIQVKCINNWTPKNKHTLWYKKPAKVWMTSTLPIGNGQFGGCVMGGVKRDEVQFNDKTLWRGHVGSIVGNGAYGSYLNFGNLYITSTDNTITKATKYHRWLDIDEAKAGVAYTANNVAYQREYICSYPDKVIAIKYTADKKGKINNNIILFNQNGNAPTYQVNNNIGIITFKGEVPRTGTTKNEAYYCTARIVTKGGAVKANAQGGIEVANADEMFIYLWGATNFDASNDDYVSDASLLPAMVNNTVEKAVQKGYHAICNDHVADYQSLYNRCSLNITEAKSTETTNKLIEKFAANQADNLLLEELYFCYGRYLMIGCSRGVDLPSNLQGIWNDNNSPAWNSDIHSNINVQMNYWPAEITNLSELHLPYLNYIHREACVRPQWRANAKQIAKQTKGWTLTTENNIYGSGSNWSQNYTIANAWYCMHLWQHYRFTLDKEYLAKTAYPAMRSCAEYWLERLVKAKDGTYECPNEYSPEHGPQSENATAHSQQLVWDLFNNTLQAIEALNLEEDATFLTDLKDKFKHLDTGLKTEKVWGKTLLREWKYTSQYKVHSYNSHRHMSHLMGLYPGNQIAKDIDANIYQAALNSLNTRGYEGTGWSMGWKVNLHARAHDGDRCQALLKTALHSQTNTGNSEGGGVYENLWDAHTPYQIDGNFGACAGMAEMLMQSHTGKIELLPALPSLWKKGEVKGLCAVNCFEVDIRWHDNKMVSATIKSKAGKKLVVKYKDIATLFTLKDSKGNTIKATNVSNDEIMFDTEKGATYIFTTTDPAGIKNIANNNSSDNQKVVATHYYLMNGTEIHNPIQKGVYIAKKQYANGKKKVAKVLINE